MDPITEDERQKIELAFERTLGEYDEEEIGELEDVSWDSLFAFMF